jgi:hypothetical protein
MLQSRALDSGGEEGQRRAGGEATFDKRTTVEKNQKVLPSVNGDRAAGVLLR